MKYLKIYLTHIQFSNNISNNISTTQYPNISYCGEDQQIHLTENPLRTIKIYIDDFETGTLKEYVQTYNLLNDTNFTVNEFFDYYFENINTINPNKFAYTGELFTWNGSSYYLWENINGGYGSVASYVLTTTIDSDFLLEHSIEYDYSNYYCPYVAMLADDYETSYEQGDFRLILDALVRVESGNNSLSIYIDKFRIPMENDPEYYLPDIAARADFSGYYTDVSSYLDDCTKWLVPDQGATNNFIYTGTTMFWENKEYYLWESEDTILTGCSYILTESADYNFLYNNALLTNINNSYAPIIAKLDGDKDIDYTQNQCFTDLLIKVEYYDTPLYMLIDNFYDDYDLTNSVNIPYWASLHYQTIPDYINNICKNPKKYYTSIYKLEDFTFTYNSTLYYIWTLLNYDPTFNFLILTKYILTNTINYEYLYNHSLKANNDSSYNPIIYFLDSDHSLSTYNNRKGNYILIDITTKNPV